MIDKLIGDISTVMYSYVLIILLLATGLYFTFRTRFVQFRMFLESIRVVGEKPEKAGATSSFQALMVSTASRVGTGNIIGISTAICAGGFGAVFWMWVIAIIGGASANVSHPVKQGLVQMLSVFIDTLLICTATAFMLLCSGVEPDAALEGAPYVQAALSAVFGPIGPMFITVAMVLFAFTTLIGNLYYVDNCLNYIVKKVPAKEFMVLFRIDAMLLIFIGAGMQIGTVWNLADVLMGVMALINLPVIILLSRPALLALKDYTAQKNTGRNPVFKAETVGLKGKTEYWN